MISRQTLNMSNVAKKIGADREREARTLAQAVGAELTDLRTARGWPQETVAERSGYSVGYVRETELGGNPSLELLTALAATFSLALSDLVRAAEDRVRQNSTAPAQPPK
jgi:transcriptional regulator with XRE-family HTH domain